MPLFIGSAALGVETAAWYHDSLTLQQTADKAVYSAAIEKRAGSTAQVILSSATKAATQNGFVPGTIIVNDPPTSGAYVGVSNTIQVTMSTHVNRYFSAVFDTSEVVANAKAVAIIQTASSSCLLALNTSASGAIQVSGGASLSLSGCTVMSDSTASNSVNVQNSAKLSADCIITVGDVSLPSGSTTTLCPNIVTNAPPVADPFVNLAVPTSATNWSNSNGAVLQPGNYTNGMDLHGATTLAPGVYIVSGTFRINAQANILGAGVTIYLSKGTSLSINGTATLNLSAPTSGPYSGVLFFGDRASTGSVTFNGTAASKLTGALYFANQNVSYLGNYSGNGGCTRVIANTISWSGSTSINQNCSAYGMSSIGATVLIKLVE